MKNRGNAKVNMQYNPHSDKHPFPSFSGDMENYIRDKYERKLFMEDISSSNSRSIQNLRANSATKAGIKDDNLLDFDDEPSPESSMPSRADIRYPVKESAIEPTPISSHSPYGNQLALLAEMGFVDSEFNLKALKAANGNTQEALEIIVAANQKQTRKPSGHSILDEIHAVDRASSKNRLGQDPHRMNGLQSAIDALDPFNTGKSDMSYMQSGSGIKSPPLPAMNEWGEESVTPDDRVATQSLYDDSFSAPDPSEGFKPLERKGRQNANDLDSKTAAEEWSTSVSSQMNENSIDGRENGKAGTKSTESFDPLSFNPFAGLPNSTDHRLTDNPW